MWICSLVSLKTAVGAAIWWEKKDSCPVVRTKNNFAFLIGSRSNTQPISESDLLGKSHFRNYLIIIRRIFRTESFCEFSNILRLKVDYLQIQHWLVYDVCSGHAQFFFYEIGWKILNNILIYFSFQSMKFLQLITWWNISLCANCTVRILRSFQMTWHLVSFNIMSSFLNFLFYSCC
jgi:hypothetical protein